MVRRKPGHAKPGPKRKRKQTKIIDGWYYEFDRQYATRAGAMRRAKEIGARMTKRPNVDVWYTWVPTGRRVRK